MKLTVWTVNLDTVSMRRLLEWCLREHKVDRMLLVVPSRSKKHKGKWEPLVPGVRERTEALFGPYIREKFLAAAWPGRGVGPPPGLVYVLEVNPVVKELMLKTEPKLKRWLISREPPLPEDICLFKMGERHPILVTIIHEEDAWLVTMKQPRLRGVSFEKAIKIEDLQRECLGYKDKYFCQEWRGR